MKVTAGAHLTKNVCISKIFGFTEANDDRFKSGRFHLRDFGDLSLGVIGRPFTCLLAVLKISGSHFAAVLSEPLPISCEHVINDVTPGLDASVLMTVDALFHASVPSG
jgi:hypothetical protein